MDNLFFLGRLLMGGYFIMNGYNHLKNVAGLTGYAKAKGVPYAREGVLVSGVMLILGGLGILLWVYVDLAVLLLSVFLIVTTFKMHQYWKVADPMQRMGEHVNFYKNLALLGGVLMLLFVPIASMF